METVTQTEHQPEQKANHSLELDPKAIVYAADKTAIPPRQVVAVLHLLVNEQCTVPFVARYRKEKTGDLDEVAIRQIHEFYLECIEIEKRRLYILDAVRKMEQMTPEIEMAILKSTTLLQLEEIYAPFKAKKKTKAMIAKEFGLEPISLEILTSKTPWAKFVEANQATLNTLIENSGGKLKTTQDLLAGALDILNERFSHHPDIKEKLRQFFWNEGKIECKIRDGVLEGNEIDKEEVLKFKDFFDYQGSLKSLKEAKASHRFLAMRRGVTQKILKLEIASEQGLGISLIEQEFFSEGPALGNYDLLKKTAEKAYNNAIHPSLDLEFKTELKKLADEAAIDVFGVNLKNLLLQPYLGPKAVLGVDPGLRTGCKVVLVDHTGKLIGDYVIYPHAPKHDTDNAALIINKTLEVYPITHIAIGNGTAGRETLEFFEKHITKVKDGKVKATIVSEAGASVYSASDIAREEFPDKDVTVRGAVSIARRFQDPLAELVKIDPKSIGVGQYQHDVNQIRLKKSLENVVEDCVNFVGVDLNTASAPLLSFISGVGPSVAQGIVKYRETQGGLKTRAELLKIPRFTKKIFEQAAGFMRIYQGENPLDSTFIHPERYAALERYAEKKNLKITDLVQQKELIVDLERDQELLKEVGELTLKDIVKSLKSPSQDPRTEFKSVDFHAGLKEFKNVELGQWYTGVVNNITMFGAFVDIGIKESGLLHISEIADHYVENALSQLKVGQQVKVKVIDIDFERKRISLSLRSDSQAQKSGGRPQGQDAHSGGAKKINLQEQQEIKNNPFAKLKNFKV